MTSDHDTITLKDAASHFGYTVSTLRAEADRGRLTIYKIGKQYRVKPKDVQALDRCWFAKKNAKPVGSGIYVIGFHVYVKIGWSADLPARLRGLQSALPVGLTIYATFQCDKTNEGILLRRFREYKTRGEWFRNEGRIAEWVKRGCPL